MPRYLLTLSYFGKNYHGSQRQNTHTTIQEELENALSTLIKQKISTIPSERAEAKQDFDSPSKRDVARIRVIFSGRTDAKVSANAQTLHFDVEDKLEAEKFLYSLNAILPNDIAVKKMTEVDSSFHAQMSAKYRHYQYKIRTTKEASPFDLNVFHLKQDLNVENLNSALNCIIGEHDFSAFKSVSDNPAKICKIFQAEAKREGEYILIDIIGNRFLYNMVRTIVGTLLMLGKDNIEPLTMKKILNSKDRKLAGPTANAIGLTLVEVGYEEYKQKKGK